MLFRSSIRRAGIERVNLDLIYGAVGESLSDWRATIELALQLSPSHVSAYALTVEAGTPLAASPERHPAAARELGGSPTL